MMAHLICSAIFIAIIALFIVYPITILIVPAIPIVVMLLLGIAELYISFHGWISSLLESRK